MELEVGGSSPLGHPTMALTTLSSKGVKYIKYSFAGVVGIIIIAALFQAYSKLNIASSSNKIATRNNVSPSPTQFLSPLHAITTRQLTKKIVTPTPSHTVTPTVGLVESGFCMRVPILFYHHIQPMAEAKAQGHGQLTVDVNYFDQQMAYLNARGYRTISADELVNALSSRQSLSGNPIVVTLDDGYKDIYDYAFGIAKKYNITLNLMISSGLIGNSGYMSWDNLKEMVNSGKAYAYDHTWSHYSLPTGDAKKIEYEIVTAKTQLEQQLGKPQKIFAYPYGAVNNLTIDILKKNGFIAAFTTVNSFMQCDSSMFTLRRNRIGNAPLATYGI